MWESVFTNKVSTGNLIIVLGRAFEINCIPFAQVCDTVVTRSYARLVGPHLHAHVLYIAISIMFHDRVFGSNFYSYSMRRTFTLIFV